LGGSAIPLFGDRENSPDVQLATSIKKKQKKEDSFIFQGKNSPRAKKNT
jgi:hypothetical protein